MHRIFQATKDTYITDRVINGQRKHSTNTGRAGTIDIFKLTGFNYSGSISLTELSRGLIKFDTDSVRALVNSGSIVLSDSSFKAYIKLFDVYGGQTTPQNYKLIVYPLSKSFDEGIGRDVTYYSDSDVCNFLTSSYDPDTSAYSVWNMSGANAKGLLGSSDIDVIASGSIGSGVQSLFVTQSFVDGTENLVVDVTHVISATLTNQLPDHGFRISLFETYENNNKTYFVKRFASKDCVTDNLKPRLIIKYNDSRSDTSEFVLDKTTTRYLYNRTRSGLSNLTSGSSELTGSNCILMRLETEHSGSTYSFFVTGSQHSFNGLFVSGTYSAAINVPSTNVNVQRIIQASGSLRVKEIWSTLDHAIGYFTSSYQYFELPTAGTRNPTLREYKVSAYNCKSQYNPSETHRIKVFCQQKDHTHIARRQPIITPSDFPTEIHYSIRDLKSNDVIIPFDKVNKSTKMSNDSHEFYFDLYPGDFPTGGLYTIDVLLLDGDSVELTYKNVGSPFTVMSD